MAKTEKLGECPHCGYENVVLPNGRCGLCIPPDFRAKTAAQFMAEEMRRLGSSGSASENSAYFAVLAADNLIAVLTGKAVDSGKA